MKRGLGRLPPWGSGEVEMEKLQSVFTVLHFYLKRSQALVYHLPRARGQAQRIPRALVHDEEIDLQKMALQGKA